MRRFADPVNAARAWPFRERYEANKYGMRRYIDIIAEMQNAYPLADRDRDGWYSDGDYAARGGEIVWMSPDEYLDRVRPLALDDESRDNIDDLKAHIEAGRPLDPLKIYASGEEDGRHRAHAAKELGIAQVPVIIFRDY